MTKCNNPYKFKGRPFHLGVVNLLDGEIEQVISYNVAKSNDWHHSFYVKGSLQSKMEDGEADMFWFDKGSIINFDNNIPNNIKAEIWKQIEQNERCIE